MTDEGRRIALGNIADFEFAELARKIAFSIETRDAELDKEDIGRPDNRCECCKTETLGSHFCQDCCRIGIRIIADTLLKIHNERDEWKIRKAANSSNFFGYFRGMT